MRHASASTVVTTVTPTAKDAIAALNCSVGDAGHFCRPFQNLEANRE